MEFSEAQNDTNSHDRSTDDSMPQAYRRSLVFIDKLDQ
jgi:hypothetical protein